MNLFSVSLLFSFVFSNSFATSPFASSSSLLNENRGWNLTPIRTLRMAPTSKQSIDDVFMSRKNAVTLAQFPRGGDVTEIVSANTNIKTKIYNWCVATNSRCWAMLVTAIGMEIVATSLIKKSYSNKNTIYIGVAFLFYIGCLGLFGLTLSRIEMSVAYAVWSGLGTGLATAVGMFVFNETKSPAKMFCVSMILLGCVGLNLVTSDS